ncbi:MAG: tyrosine--tRNA ligase [Candidatus Thermoplasmatota archaeon]|nr:tyrosine--tRNA ligase [Candidatus Thermoplasmatota archaeon]MEC8258472.1 tyrosine--tRNA ligase [Candidatus Thermoplasmatota archaeon]MEC8312790.1 tyrosine--tRNA ligase [Candidatus Thermoplasmatota archaeon]MEC8352720.1 tyrosine--tRNA ligase [Candidatus Thermoplasmatota archaeon]
MDIEQMMIQYQERCPRINELTEQQIARVHKIIGSVEETVGLDYLVDCIAEGKSARGDGVLRCYVGFEPSGKAHIGWKVLSLQLKRMLEADVNVLIFLADWHAWINDKFNGNMADIQLTAQYMEETFRALLDYPPEGDGPGELRFYYASQLMDSGDYWARVLRCSKGATLAMVRKTFTIMGRDEASSDHDLSKFFYPAMQASDIFELDIDIAIGGMDQRKAHMFMRDVASKYGWEKATCLHTPIISSLKSSGSRMESFDHKMSKSDPGGAILIHDEPKKLRKKMQKHAYLNIEDENSPVYELAQHVILPEFGEIVVTPNPKFGEPSTWKSLDDFRSAVMDGTIHPLDAKFGIADGISRGLDTVTKHFEKNPELLNKVTEIINRK